MIEWKIDWILKVFWMWWLELNFKWKFERLNALNWKYGLFKYYWISFCMNKNEVLCTRKMLYDDQWDMNCVQIPSPSKDQCYKTFETMLMYLGNHGRTLRSMDTEDNLNQWTLMQAWIMRSYIGDALMRPWNINENLSEIRFWIKWTSNK